MPNSEPSNNPFLSNTAINMPTSKPSIVVRLHHDRRHSNMALELLHHPVTAQIPLQMANDHIKIQTNELEIRLIVVF